MNTFYRICGVVYSFIFMLFFACIMICPFGEKKLLAMILEALEINFYQTSQYDIVVFILGLVGTLISIVILTSCIRGRHISKYIAQSNERGNINISVSSIENIALAMARRFQGVKDAKAKAFFIDDTVTLTVKLQVYTDVNIPELCLGIQERVKESIETTTDLKVANVSVNVDSVSQQGT